MKAAVVTAPGTIPAYGEFREPSSNDGTLLDVRACALSQLTRARASGAHYSLSGVYPFVPGVDGVGAADGRRSYFLLPVAPFGGMAERVAVRVSQLVPVPDGIDDATAAAIAIPGMSSYAALVERARLVPGETVLINGATGTSGKLAVRIARHLGAARVLATGRNAAVLATLDADETVALESDGAATALKRAFAGGVDVVLDYLWGPSALALIRAHDAGGDPERALRFVQIGSIGGAEIALPGSALRSSGLLLMGSGLGSVSQPRILAAIGAVFATVDPAKLAVETRVEPLARIAAVWNEPGSDRVVFVP